jgi:murein DD-endopeptidase MepM/ murein hydrolase activator NlpD
MDAFDIEFSAPVDPSGFTRGHGGPNVGGHQGPNWYIQYGMDLGGEEGTPVYAAFDGHVTKFAPHDPVADSPKVYGAQIFVRSANDGMGAFYTHLADTPEWLAVGAEVTRGDQLGTVMANAGIPPHLHLALVEIIGGAPGGQYQGVDLYQSFLDLEAGEAGTVVPVTFAQDGSAPQPQTAEV